MTVEDTHHDQKHRMNKELNPIEPSPAPFTPGAAETRTPSSGVRRAMRAQASADAITGFMAALLARGIVSEETVREATTRKRTLGEGDRRHLFQLLIDDFGADREQVYAEFTRYYSFKTVDAASLRLTAERYTFITKALEQLSPNLRELAEEIKILPFQTVEGDASKLQLLTPDPTNPENVRVARFARFELGGA